MPATIDRLRPDLGYAFACGVTPPEQPMVRGTALVILDWARIHTPYDEDQPFTERLWVAGGPVIWPRVGQILLGLERGNSIDVSLETDLVPFRSVHLTPQAEQRLGLRGDDPRTTHRAKAILDADSLGWSHDVRAFLLNHPDAHLRLFRDVGGGDGWWRIEPCE